MGRGALVRGSGALAASADGGRLGGATALPVGLRVKGRFLDAATCGGVKLREDEALGAEVFQRCADEVEFFVVDDEKSVVELSQNLRQQHAPDSSWSPL